MILLGGLGIELLGVVGTTATSITLENRVEVLRKANDELEAKTRPRIITQKQIDDFKFFTSSVKKIPIRIAVGPQGFDTETFASQLRLMFDHAGFMRDTNASASGAWGVTSLPGIVQGRPIGSTDAPPELEIMYYCTNATPRPIEYHLTLPVFGRALREGE